MSFGFQQTTSIPYYEMYKWLPDHSCTLEHSFSPGMHKIPDLSHIDHFTYDMGSSQFYGLNQNSQQNVIDLIRTNPEVKVTSVADIDS